MNDFFVARIQSQVILCSLFTHQLENDIKIEKK